jgi:nucleotide-binding universal stress UspA family protein
MFEKMLVAIDGSEHSPAVLKAAGELASQLGATVRVLHVLEMGFAGRAGAVPLVEKDESEKVVDDAVAQLKSQGLDVTGVLRSALHGRVAGEITDEANEWGASGIVTGSRGLTGLEGVFVGSTTHKLLHLSEVPVLVVR